MSEKNDFWGFRAFMHPKIKNFGTHVMFPLKNKFGKKNIFMMNFQVKRSKKRFLGFLTIAIRKKTFYFFSFWLAAFFYPFYIKNEKK